MRDVVACLGAVPGSRCGCVRQKRRAPEGNPSTGRTPRGGRARPHVGAAVRVADGIAALLVIPLLVIEDSNFGEPWDTIGVILNWGTWLDVRGRVSGDGLRHAEAAGVDQEQPVGRGGDGALAPFIPGSLAAARLFRLFRLFRLRAPVQVAEPALAGRGALDSLPHRDGGARRRRGLRRGRARRRPQHLGRNLVVGDHGDDGELWRHQASLDGEMPAAFKSDPDRYRAAAEAIRRGTAAMPRGLAPYVDDTEGEDDPPEGRRLLERHYRRERNAAKVAAKKRKVLAETAVWSARLRRPRGARPAGGAAGARVGEEHLGVAPRREGVALHGTRHDSRRGRGSPPPRNRLGPPRAETGRPPG